MKRKKLTAEQRRLSIIEATTRVVARLNYDRATTALIAKEAGINQALIYNHFKSKQELQVAMLDHIQETLVGIYMANPVFQGEHPEQSTLQALTIQYHANLNEEVQLWACVIKAMVAIDKEIREKAWDIIKQNQMNIQDYLIKDYRPKLKGTHFDGEMMSWSVFASILLFSSLAMMDKIDEIPKGKIFDSVQDLEKLILGGK